MRFFENILRKVIILRENRKSNISYKHFLNPGGYTADGDFMNFGDLYEDFLSSDRMILDELGRIKTLNEGVWVDNPVTAAEYALAIYGQYLRNSMSEEDFLYAARNLLYLQQEDGGLRYYYNYPYYLDSEHYMKSGWVSGMAQGHALSVYARAYNLTKEDIWAEASEKVIEFMGIPIKNGGVKSDLSSLDSGLENYITYEEYPCMPPSYTLNGFMYATIGLFDWAVLGKEGASKRQADKAFNMCIDSLKVLLPFFDLDGVSSYDLGQIVWHRKKPHVVAHYHAIHVAFCLIFYQITSEPVFEKYYYRWKRLAE